MTPHSIRVPEALWKELTALKYKHGHKSMAGLLTYLLDEHKKAERKVPRS
jgi:hypothetical protein